MLAICPVVRAPSGQGEKTAPWLTNCTCTLLIVHTHTHECIHTRSTQMVYTHTLNMWLTVSFSNTHQVFVKFVGSESNTMQAAIKGISIFLFIHYLNMHTCRKQLHTYYIQCAHSPRGSLMPEVRAAPTPLHANTTCCHSNRDKRWICTPPSSSLPYFLFQYFFFFFF